jgi:hypothetical protein
MSVHVHIETLVLDGLPPDLAAGPAVKSALEAELTRLLAENDKVPAFCQGAALVRGADLQVASAATPALLGQQIGSAVHGSLVP